MGRLRDDGTARRGSGRVSGFALQTQSNPTMRTSLSLIYKLLLVLFLTNPPAVNNLEVNYNVRVGPTWHESFASHNVRYLPPAALRVHTTLL